jgi:hypothetical protein
MTLPDYSIRFCGFHPNLAIEAKTFNTEETEEAEDWKEIGGTIRDAGAKARKTQ